MAAPSATTGASVSGRDRWGGLFSLIGWRFVLAAALGCLAAAGFYADGGLARRGPWALGSLVAIGILVGLVWEIATQRARCGFKPLE